MTHDEDKKGPSRLEKHLKIMGLGGEDVPEAALTAERRAIEEATPLALRLPASRLPARRKSLFHMTSWSWGVSALAAAVLTVVIVGRGKDETQPLTIKGAASVQVFAEQGGTVTPLPSNADLPAGARVKAEVLAGAPSEAFWGVVGRDGRLLSDAAWITQSRLDLAANERKAFAGSLELDGPSEGEILVVVVCAAGVAATDVAKNFAVDPLPLPLQACRMQRFPLRR